MTDKTIGEELNSIDWKQVLKLGVVGVGLAGFYEWIKIKLHKYYKDED